MLKKVANGGPAGAQELERQQGPLEPSWRAFRQRLPAAQRHLAALHLHRVRFPTSRKNRAFR